MLSGVTTGSTYKFIIQARNSYGYSANSTEVLILAAQTPVQPAAPTTTFRPDNVTIQWSKPNENGSPIIGYKIFIRKHDGTVALELTQCNGSSAAIVQYTNCTVNVTTLVNTPFLLSWGSSV